MKKQYIQPSFQKIEICKAEICVGSNIGVDNDERKYGDGDNTIFAAPPARHNGWDDYENGN